MSNGLFEAGVRDNYSLHLIVAFMIIIGGLGFPVIINGYNYLKNAFVNATHHYIDKLEHRHTTRIFTTNTKIVITTTGALLLVGFITFFAFEYQHSLQRLSWYGKIVTAFFGSVTPVRRVSIR